MKVLFGMPAKESRGGPIATEPPFVEAFRALGHDIAEEVWVYGDQDKPTPLIQRFFRVVRSALRLRRRLAEKEFDLVHLNTAFDRKTILRDSVTLFLMRPRRTKVFLKIHGSSAAEFRETRGLFRILINYIIKRADCFGVFSRDEFDDFVSIGFDPGKIRFIKNAVLIGDSLPANSERLINPANGPFRLAFAARFVETKGLIETLHACAELRRREIDFHLTAMGSGEVAEKAIEESVRLGIDDAVEFTGYIPETEVARRLRESDALVFPTRHDEGFPMVLFNAATLGLPIITTQIRAARDYFEDRVNCLFCRPEPKDIAEKIEELMNDRELRESMSVANRELGKSLTPDKIAREYEEVYEAVLRS